MSNFFNKFKKEQPKVDEVDVEVKEYPAWVLQAKSPDKTMVMFDVVEDLWEKAKDKIKINDYKTISEVKISDTTVCERIPFFKGRSGLKNHSKVKDWIKLRNEDLAKRLLDAKAKGAGKSTVRKSKSMLRAERDKYIDKHTAKTQVELFRLLEIDMLVDQADSIRVNAEQKQTINELHKQIAEIKHVNKYLQEEVRTLEEKLFKAQKPLVLKVKK
jgi:uncharacterized coiled-coil protein SlyX